MNTTPTLPPQYWSNPDGFYRLFPLESERLRYRMLASEDLDHMLAHRSDPEVCRYVAPPMNREQVSALVEARRIWTGADGHMVGLIPLLKSEDRPIGELGLRIESTADRRIEIGYILQTPHFGKGYATEIARTLMDFCFNQMGAHKVVGRCDPQNHASVRILEKLGMVREALFRHHYMRGGVWTDTAVYAALSPLD